jgi:hypothetical protein
MAVIVPMRHKISILPDLKITAAETFVGSAVFQLGSTLGVCDNATFKVLTEVLIKSQSSVV